MEADVVVVLDVYAAGEAPIAGADGRAIARAIRTRGTVEPVFVETLEELQPVLESLLDSVGEFWMIVFDRKRVVTFLIDDLLCD